jgi:hypothetical protein
MELKTGGKRRQDHTYPNNGNFHALFETKIRGNSSKNLYFPWGLPSKFQKKIPLRKLVENPTLGGSESDIREKG